MKTYNLLFATGSGTIRQVIKADSSSINSHTVNFYTRDAAGVNLLVFVIGTSNLLTMEVINED